MLEVRSSAYLRDILELFGKRSSDRKGDRNFFNDILTIVRNNIEFIDKKNVVPIAELLQNYAFNFVYNPNPDSEILEKVNHIRDFIFGFTNSKKKIGYIHYFTWHKDYEGVKALVRLDLRHILKPEGSRGRTALDYALKLNEREDCDDLVDYLRIFQGQPNFENLNNIICDKGNPPEGLNRVEGLLLSMRDLDLQIIRSVSYNGAIYHFTNTFVMEKKSVFGDRRLIFAWVELEGKFYPRLFWLSRSQGVWRRVDKCFKNWIGKSVRGEAGIGVPIYVNFEMYKAHQDSIQRNLFRVLPTDKGEHLLRYVVAWSENSVKKSRRFLEGRLVLPILKDRDEDQWEKSDHTELGSRSLRDESEDKEIELGQGYLPSHPLNNTFDRKEHRPDFSLCEAVATLDSPLYGNLIARVILTSDRSLRYLFLEKNIGRKTFAFLAAVEKTENTVTKLGLHEKWVDPQSLALPLFEYARQFKVDDSFLERRYSVPKPYVFTGHYLSQMPFIKAYLKYFEPKEPAKNTRLRRNRN